jgi:hypothetical protein
MFYIKGKIVYSDWLLNILGKVFIGITIFPFIILRKKFLTEQLPDVTLSHERTHLAQQLETLIVGFGVIYALHYIFNRIIKSMDHLDAYANICFEREAYDNDSNPEYLSQRKPYTWVKYLWEDFRAIISM